MQANKKDFAKTVDSPVKTCRVEEMKAQTKLQRLKPDELRALVKAGFPFWVGSETERQTVSRESKSLGRGFKTCSDGNGGYNCFIVPTIKRK